MRKSVWLVVLCLLIGFNTVDSQILYKVECQNGTAPSYIFGSHHLSPITVVEESGVMDYFSQTEQVVGEIDLSIEPMKLAMILQPYMMAPSDSTLTVLLEGEDMDALNRQFQKWSPMPGMQLQMLDQLKPVAVSTMMAAAMSAEVMPGYDPAQQLDTYFFKTGKEQGKNLMGLETPEFQGEVLFNSTPLKIQADGLIEMLKNPEESIEMARKLSEAYKNRDLNAMGKLSEESSEHPEFMEKILDKRNIDWMTKLPVIINQTPSFIVVGALHLAGDKGILEGLRKEGFVITPIY